MRLVRLARFARLFVTAAALMSAGALCGPEARLGDTCNTTIDCGLELECTAVDPAAPDDTTCELVCTSQEQCDEVFGTDANIGCLEPTFQFDVVPGQVGRCMHYAGV